MDQSTVTRKIYFCRAIPRIDDDPERNATPVIGSFDPGPIFRHLGNLDINNMQLERADGDLTFCRIFNEAGYGRLQLSTIRMAEIPQRFNRLNSSLKRLELAESEGIAESTHMVFFPNNVLGLEYNHRGPGVGRLEQYFRKKAPIEESKVSFEFLTDRDFEAKLNSLEEIRELDVRISNLEVEGSDTRPPNSQESDFFKAVEGMMEVGQVEEYGLTWKARKGSQGSIPSSFIDKAKEFGRTFGGGDDSTKLVVRGKDGEGHVQRINVLNDRLMWEKKVLRMSETDRGVRPESAFEAIEELYGQHREKIERALTVQF